MPADKPALTASAQTEIKGETRSSNKSVCKLHQEQATCILWYQTICTAGKGLDCRVFMDQLYSSLNSWQSPRMQSK